MTITLELQPEIEQGLRSQAQARGISLTDYVREIISREAHVSNTGAPPRTGQVLVDICSQVRGLADDLDITRNSSPSRPVDFS